MTTIKGIYRDRLWTPPLHAAHGSPAPALDSGWRSNIVVTQARLALAAFMKGEEDAFGIRAILVGEGEEAWDQNGPPPPDPSTTELVNAVDEREIEPDQIVFLDTNGEESEEPTTRVQVTVTYEPGEPGEEVALREFGLFGELLGDIYMIDYVRHPVINKGSQDTLERVIRLSF